jgi:hypothetical protein
MFELAKINRLFQFAYPTLIFLIALLTCNTAAQVNRVKGSAQDPFAARTSSEIRHAMDKGKDNGKLMFENVALD